MKPITHSRRDFLKATGLSASGLILGFPLQIQAASQPGDLPFEPNAFIAISPETGITLTIPVPEVGQNTRTALAMILADELGADLQAVNLHQAGPRNDVGQQMAGASAGLKRAYPVLRIAAASAREMLITGVAKHWNVNPDRCHTDNSQVFGPDGQSMSFIEAAAYGGNQSVPNAPTLKLASDFKYIGQDIRILDAQEIGMGKTQFAVDALPEGVRFAVLLRCPVLGGKLLEFDAAAAGKMRGVVDILQVGDKVAVTATNTWIAMEAAKRVRAQWDEGEYASESTKGILARQKAALDNPAETRVAQGDFESAFATAPIQLEQEFSGPFLCHSPMEPPNCTAWFHKDRVEIWTGCQSLNGLYEALPEYTGLPHERIACHQLRIGGGFGRKLDHDFIIEALEIAKLVDYPVKLMFTKEDDIRHSVYRAADRYRYRVGMDLNGYPLALQEINCQRARSWRDSAFTRYFKHAERKFTRLDLPLVTGPLRGPHDNVSCFTQHSMIDAMADRAGIDPLDFRLALLGDQKVFRLLGWAEPPAEDPVMANLVRIIRDRSNWKGDPSYGYGIAYFEKNQSKVAVAALAPKAGGSRPIEKVFVALHCGRIVNPLSARAQMESGVIDGLAAALYQRIDVQDGRVIQKNYQDYPMLAMPECPEIDIFLSPSEAEPKGLGETAYPPTMPATISALADATGRRTTDMPVFG